MIKSTTKAQLSARLQWLGYRSADLFGIPGLCAAAAAMAVLLAHVGFMRPAWANRQRELASVVRQQTAAAAQTRKLLAQQTPANVATQSESKRGAAAMLALIGKHGLPTHEVKYQQIAAGKNHGRRIAMAFSTFGNYAQFRELIEATTEFPGARPEAFTLRRNLPTERMLAIDVKLSVPQDAAQ